MKKLVFLSVLFLFLFNSQFAAAISQNFALNIGTSATACCFYDVTIPDCCEASLAIDGNTSVTRWNAPGYGTPSNPHWLIVDLGNVFSVNEIKLFTVQENLYGTAGLYVSYILYISTDSINWVRVDTGNLIDTYDPIKIVSLNGVPFQYAKYEVIGGNHWAHLVEMEIWGEGNSNESPVANAGADQTVHVGDTVTLDGSASSDPDNNVPLSYSWSINSKPSGSAAILSDNDIVNPTFVPDLVGDYSIELTVTDSLGAVSTPPASVIISTENSCPTADAGDDQAIHTTIFPISVSLDGTQSCDEDDNTDLTYNWKIVSQPAGSTASFDSNTVAEPVLSIDTIGDYVISLEVNDGWCISTADKVTISFANVPPVANAGTSQSVIIGDVVIFDGSGSSDADGDMITYNWSIVSKPTGSLSELSEATVVSPSFTPDLAGAYVIQLVVNDGLLHSEPASVQVQVITKVDAAILAVQGLADQIAALSGSDFKNANMKNALLNKLNAVMSKIDAENYKGALSQIENDILGKTNGCAETGKVDKNDWIRNCTAQDLVYVLVIDVIDVLETLL